MAKFPPLPPHPDCHVMRWTESEIRAIRARDLEIWRMAMEAAAAKCEELSDGECGLAFRDAIRALPEPSHD